MKKLILILLIIMALDYGALVSQRGYDAKTCADRFLAFSSAFQTLKVFSVTSVTTTKPMGVNTITITHNLGYFAPFIIVYNGSTTSGLTKSFFNYHNGFGYFDVNPYISARQYTDRLEIDVDGNFDLDAGTVVGDTVYFTVYQFLDDFSTIAEKNINTGLTSGSSSDDYGIRISKEGFDVKTCDDIDCVFSSSFFNQIVHKRGIISETETYDELSVSHNLGYVPNFISFVKNNANNYIEYFPRYYSVTNNKLVLNPLQYGDNSHYYIIFKNILT